LRRGAILGAAVASLISAGAAAEDVVVPLEEGRIVRFLGAASAREAIVSEEGDPFFKTLSRFDLEARLGRSIDGISREEAVQLLRKRFQNACVEWTRDEVETLVESCRRLWGRARELCPGFIPAEWKFIKTDGSEEGGAAYTRADAIILPVSKLGWNLGGRGGARLDRLVAHETCHVYGRRNSGVRARLFDRLGFAFVGPIDLGEELAARSITNPDGPIVDAVIRLSLRGGREIDAAMVLYAPVERPNFQESGRGVMPYLQFGFFEAEETPEGWRLAREPGAAPRARKIQEVSGFFERIGRNTTYFIGPDEILAENVAIGLAGAEEEIPNPEIPRDLLKVIRRAHAE
jgi:hypothetical protein